MQRPGVVRQAVPPGALFCLSELSHVQSPDWSPWWSPFAFVSLFPFSSLSHPFLPRYSHVFCHHFLLQISEIAAAFFARHVLEPGAGSPEQGARPWALCSWPCLACLPTSATFPPSLEPPTPSSPAVSSSLGFPLGLQGGWRDSLSARGELKVAWAPHCSSPGPAQPGPSSSTYISVLSHFSRGGAGRERMWLHPQSIWAQGCPRAPRRPPPPSSPTLFPPRRGAMTNQMMAVGWTWHFWERSRQRRKWTWLDLALCKTFPKLESHTQSPATHPHATLPPHP